MKRKAIPKKMRVVIFEKTSGRCGYCGEVLKRWNVDHMESISNGGKHEPENMIAACFPCNNYKHRSTVEQFRRQIERQIEMLLNYSVNYRTARRFNLVKPTPHKIVFYFEDLLYKISKN